MHRAVGTITEWLETAHGSELVARAAAASAAVLPFFCCPERVCAFLNVAHASDGFRLLIDLTEAAMHHLIVTFPSASVFCVLETSTAGFGALRPALQCPLEGIQLLLDDIVAVDGWHRVFMDDVLIRQARACVVLLRYDQNNNRVMKGPICVESFNVIFYVVIPLDTKIYEGP